jgi:protein O-mannosyl-transferase
LIDLTGSRYNLSITPSDVALNIDKKPRDYLLILAPVLILVVIGWLGVWSNHFESGFHFDDVPTIVANPYIQHPSGVARFFTNPRVSSRDKDTAAYHPLLSTWFAMDYWLGGGKPFAFQMENFFWFVALLVALALLFLRIPGIHYLGAAFATLLFGLHPVTADTVNYALQRGVIMGSFGVIAGMLIWVVWPWQLPQTLPLTLKRVPEHGWDEFLRKNFNRLEDLYLKIIHAPVGLYLWPVVPALLAEPAAAVFAPILVAYIVLFENELSEKKRTVRNAIPAGVVCGGYWIFQLVFAWKVGEISRIPTANYWFTQPWVAMRYLFKFFVPVHLSADTDFPAFAHPWDPLAIAGYVGVTGLVILAVRLGRKPVWRTVSFGIWWFLLALLPDAVVPHRVVEADWRMFLPFAGLALSVAGLASIALEAVLNRSPRTKGTPEGAEVGLAPQILIFAAGGVLAVGLAGLLGWATFERNTVWESEPALWSDVLAKSPRNGRGLMNFGLTRPRDTSQQVAFGYLERAATVSPHDPLIEVNLARGYARLSQPAAAEARFRRATADAPSWSPAWSAYADWLLAEARISEAFQMASKAVALDAWDFAGRRAMMDVMAQRHEWTTLKQFANETLRLSPNDPDGQSSLLVAQAAIDAVGKAETVATAEPSIDHYLNLSVLYYETQRYEDCIKAAREALRINPNLGEAYSNIASAYHRMGKLDETIAALEQEVRINPNLRSAKKNLAIELALKEKSGSSK